jgi:hypothetical protein
MCLSLHQRPSRRLDTFDDPVSRKRYFRSSAVTTRPPSCRSSFSASSLHDRSHALAPRCLWLTSRGGLPLGAFTAPDKAFQLSRYTTGVAPDTYATEVAPDVAEASSSGIGVRGAFPRVGEPLIACCVGLTLLPDSRWRLEERIAPEGTYGWRPAWVTPD